MKQFRARSAAVILAALLAATAAAPAQAAPLSAGPALLVSTAAGAKIPASAGGLVVTDGFRDEFARLRCLFFRC